MKNVLLYNYNLEPENLNTIGDHECSFYVNYEKYYFVVFNRPLEDLEEIYAISQSLKPYYHHIIKNRFDTPATPYMGKNYCLIKMNGPENNEIDVLDLIKDTVPFTQNKSPLLRTDWGNLWSSKVDYLEYQISELGTTHKVVRHSFSYYVGLAENAIEYFNLLKPDDLTTVISHRRIKTPFRSKDYYNPLDIIIDYKARDYASYFKMKFFEKKDVLEEVRLLVQKDILNPLEYNLLFCRLLYPSYYFDALHQVLEHDADDDSLLKYIDLVNDYEDFLRNVYDLFKTKSSMLKIDWLVSKS